MTRMLPGRLVPLSCAQAEALLAVDWGPGDDGPVPWGTQVSPGGEPTVRPLSEAVGLTYPAQLGAPVTAVRRDHAEPHVVLLRPEEVQTLVVAGDPMQPIPDTRGIFRDPRYARHPASEAVPLSVLEVRDGRWSLAVFTPPPQPGPWIHHPLDLPGPRPLEHACLLGHDGGDLLVYKAHVPGVVRPAADGSLPQSPEPAMGHAALGVLHGQWLHADFTPRGEPFVLVDEPVFAFDIDRLDSQLVVAAVMPHGLSLFELSVTDDRIERVTTLSIHHSAPLCSPAVLATDAGARCLVLASPRTSEATVLTFPS